MALNNEDIKQLIAILQKGLTQEENNNDNPEPKTVNNIKKHKNNIKTKKTKIVDQENNENKFISMGYHHLHKEDTAIDKILSKNPPSPRNRKFNKTNVRCRVCGKQESINSSILYESPDRYKCNKCCSSPG
jgi:predicted transcriptional regulator